MASLFLWLFDQLFYGKVPPTPRGGFGREGLHYRFRDKELGLGIVNYFKGYQMQTGPTFTIHNCTAIQSECPQFFTYFCSDCHQSTFSPQYLLARQLLAYLVTDLPSIYSSTLSPVSTQLRLVS